MSTKESVIKINDEILLFLLEFKKQHPDFTFSLRKRDSPQSKEKRLSSGHWFQGGGYIYVPLFKRGDNDRKIKTLGFVLTFDENGGVFENYLEISFKSGITSQAEIQFHEELASEIKLSLNPDRHARKLYPNPQTYLDNLQDYITRVRDIAISLLKKHKIEADYLVSESDFQQKLARTLAIRKGLQSPIASKTTIDTAKMGTTIKVAPLNQILYGPPGTGKTYNTIEKALRIIGEKEEQDLKWDDREAVTKQFRKRLEEGRIVFTTFHQSMSYEDFIEGIKPMDPDADGGNIGYETKAGIFKDLCERASLKSNPTNFDAAYKKFVEDVEELGELDLLTPSQSKPFRIEINGSRNPVAIPRTQAQARMVVTKEMIRNYIADGSIRDWKPYTVAISEYLRSHYPIESSGIDNSQQPYVLIIDEINRGNVSQIFGELITLIEDDKRKGMAEALEAKLPYSKRPFSVPPNLYIIGTMNTADRSVEALDAALRRRFSFEEMPPRPELIKTEGKAHEGKVDEIDLVNLLEIINKRIEVLKFSIKIVTEPTNYLRPSVLAF